MLALPCDAFGGRLIATGHDAYSYCSGVDGPGQCHFVNVAVNYVRGGAPVPSRKMLLLDCSAGGRQDAARHAQVPDLHEEAQVQAPAEAVVGFW